MRAHDVALKAVAGTVLLLVIFGTHAPHSAVAANPVEDEFEKVKETLKAIRIGEGTKDGYWHRKEAYWNAGYSHAENPGLFMQQLREQLKEAKRQQQKQQKRDAETRTGQNVPLDLEGDLHPEEEFEDSEAGARHGDEFDAWPEELDAYLEEEWDASREEESEEDLDGDEAFEADAHHGEESDVSPPEEKSGASGADATRGEEYLRGGVSANE